MIILELLDIYLSRFCADFAQNCCYNTGHNNICFLCNKLKLSTIMLDNIHKIIHISDLIKDKHQKEKELEYYEKCLSELLIKMSMVKRDIDLTNIIIDCIKTEKVDAMQKFFDKKDQERILDF